MSSIQSITLGALHLNERRPITAGKDEFMVAGLSEGPGWAR